MWRSMVWGSARRRPDRDVRLWNRTCLFAVLLEVL